MDGRPTWTDCDEAGDYVVPNVLSPRDLVFRPDNMDETVPHTLKQRFKMFPSSNAKSHNKMSNPITVVTSEPMCVSGIGSQYKGKHFKRFLGDI